jgi:hypothetical protein
MRASWRHMSMDKLRRSPSALAWLVVCGALLTSGCGEGESSSAEGCILAPTIGFHGRQYTESDELNGLPERQFRVGRSLGVGELPAYCGRGDGDRVQVFKVVGVPVERAVFAEPPYGLAVRSHFDEG